MTLKNNTAVSRSFVLVRYADINANNSLANWFDKDHPSARGYNNERNVFGVTLYSIPTATPHFAVIADETFGPDPCDPEALTPAGTPWLRDGSVILDWNGTLGASKAVTTTAEYRRF
jgi:hypothetical protein